MTSDARTRETRRNSRGRVFLSRFGTNVPVPPSGRLSDGRVRDSRHRRELELEHRVESIELSLHDLSSAWIDAMDDWQSAIRDGDGNEQQTRKRLQKVEHRLQRLARRQRKDAKAFTAALDNASL